MKIIDLLRYIEKKAIDTDRVDLLEGFKREEIITVAEDAKRLGYISIEETGTPYVMFSDGEYLKVDSLEKHRYLVMLLPPGYEFLKLKKPKESDALSFIEILFPYFDSYNGFDISDVILKYQKENGLIYTDDNLRGMRDADEDIKKVLIAEGFAE